MLSFGTGCHMEVITSEKLLDLSENTFHTEPV